MVGMFIVKLVAAILEARSIAGTTVGAVLQVILNREFASDTSCTKMSELAVTAVVFTVQVAALALVAQEKVPAA